MKSRDLYKLSDRDLLAELRTLNGGVTGDEASYGVTAAMTAALVIVLDMFEAALNALDAARAGEDAAQGSRDDARKALIEKARKLINLIRANDVSAELLGRAGLDVYDKTKTDAPAPSGVPFLLIELSKLRQILSFRDTATPDSEAKPKGMLGCEIYYFIGTEKPQSYDDYKFLALDTASPYTAIFKAEDAGKTVRYIARWRSKNGEVGEWSVVFETTING